MGKGVEKGRWSKGKEEGALNTCELGDLNKNPRWAPGFPRASGDLVDLFN